MQKVNLSFILLQSIKKNEIFFDDKQLHLHLIEINKPYLIIIRKIED